MTRALLSSVATLDPPPGDELVVAVDTLVDGVHFPPGTLAEHVGWKSLAVNLSDLAAMGAIPLTALATALDRLEGSLRKRLNGVMWNRLSEKLIKNSRYSASILSASRSFSSNAAVDDHQTESKKPSVTANRLVMTTLVA